MYFSFFSLHKNKALGVVFKDTSAGIILSAAPVNKGSSLAGYSLMLQWL